MKRAHDWYKCPDSLNMNGEDVHPSRCKFCDGGLGWCRVCGGGEAELTKDCPGRKTTGRERELVIQGRLNFVGGRWIRKGSDAEFIRCRVCKRETAAKEWTGDKCPHCKFEREPGRVAERHTRRFQKPLGLARGGSNPPAPTKPEWKRVRKNAKPFQAKQVRLPVVLMPTAIIVRPKGKR